MDIKTVVIVNDFNYIQGGASKVAIDTAILLQKKGMKVYFFSAVNKEEENVEGIEYISTKQEEALKEKNKLKGFFYGIYNFKAKRKLKKLLKTLDVNTTVIHVHGWTKALSSSIFDTIFKLKFKMVLTLHDYFTACPNGGYFDYNKNEICTLIPLSWKCIKCNCDSRNYFFKAYRIIRQSVQEKIVKLNKRLKNVITISEFSENILRNTLKQEINVCRIFNPIDIDENFTQVNPANNSYYLYVGRVTKEKGVDLFCKAISELNLKGIVVGDGTEKQKLEKEYPNIKFVGWKDKKEVKSYMKGARALIFPSRWYEGAPLTPLEAMQYGVPCISSNVSAAKDYTTHTFELNVNSLKKEIILCEQNMGEYSKESNEFFENRLKQQYEVELENFYKNLK